MKKVAIAAFLMGWILAAGGRATGSLVNPGFETEGGWNYSLSNGYDTVSRSIYAAYQGEYGLNAGTTVGWLGDINYVVASQNVAVSGGTDYSLSAWQKSLTPFSWVTLKLTWYDALNNVVSTTQADFDDSENYDWELRGLTSMAPGSATSAEVAVIAVLHPWAERAVQIDDVAFVPEPMSLLFLFAGGVSLMKKRGAVRT